MSNAELYFVLVCFMAALIGGVTYFSQREMRVHRDAEQFIQDGGHTAGDSLLNREVIFRKSWLSGFIFFLFFLLILSAGIYGLKFDLGSLNKAGKPFTAVSAYIEMLMSAVPLMTAVRQWIYKVCVSDRRLAISAFTTRTVTWEDISEVKIESLKGSSFCQIRLHTGENDLTVDSNLKGFLDFVKLLSKKVSESKARLLVRAN
jgi:hypothetical protein